MRFVDLCECESTRCEENFASHRIFYFPGRVDSIRFALFLEKRGFRRIDSIRIGKKVPSPITGLCIKEATALYSKIEFNVFN